MSMVRELSSDRELLHRLARIVESSFNEDSRFQMDESAIRILFAGVLDALAATEHPEDLLKRLEHLGQHDVMDVLFVNADLRRRVAAVGRLAVAGAQQAERVIQTINDKWFPGGPT